MNRFRSGGRRLMLTVGLYCLVGGCDVGTDPPGKITGTAQRLAESAPADAVTADTNFVTDGRDAAVIKSADASAIAALVSTPGSKGFQQHDPRLSVPTSPLGEARQARVSYRGQGLGGHEEKKADKEIPNTALPHPVSKISGAEYRRLADEYLRQWEQGKAAYQGQSEKEQDEAKAQLKRKLIGEE